jgi:hypothetical protein
LGPDDPPSFSLKAMPKRATADAPPGSLARRVSHSVSGQAREKGECENPWQNEVEDELEDGTQGDGAFDPLLICMSMDDGCTVMGVLSTAFRDAICVT